MRECYRSMPSFEYTTPPPPKKKKKKKKKIRLTTFAGQIVDPEIAVKSEMRDTLKIHNAQT